MAVTSPPARITSFWVSGKKPRSTKIRRPSSRTIGAITRNPGPPSPKVRTCNSLSAILPVTSTCRYLSATGSGAIGNAAGGSASRASISARIPAFHVMRCNCQKPSDIRIAVPTKPKINRGMRRFIRTSVQTKARALKKDSREIYREGWALMEPLQAPPPLASISHPRCRLPQTGTTIQRQRSASTMRPPRSRCGFQG